MLASSVSKIHNSVVIMGPIASQITSTAIVCSIIYSGAVQRKHSSSASMAFVRGIHRWSNDYAENVSIWWRHHVHTLSSMACLTAEVTLVSIKLWQRIVEGGVPNIDRAHGIFSSDINQLCCQLYFLPITFSNCSRFVAIVFSAGSPCINWMRVWLENIHFHLESFEK